MMTAWIGVFGTLLGVVIAGYINYRLNSAKIERENKLKNDQLVHQKLEDICKLIEDVQFVKHKRTQKWLDFVAKYQYGEEINDATFQDIFQNVSFTQLKMIIDFYIPEMRQLFDQLMETAEIQFSRLLKKSLI
ncbi:MAG: hypothetical protein ACLQVJ_08855 [Syntrophobacteraceae bacterium]